MTRAWLSAIAIAFSTGCTGFVVEPSVGAVPLPEVPREIPLPKTAGPFAWNRLSAEQIDNTLRDVLGEQRRLASQRLSAEGVGSSGFATPGLVSALEAERLDAFAQDAATAAIPKMVQGQLLPCDPASDEPGCARQSVRHLGSALFRRPLSPEELADFDALYATARADLGHTFSRALALVLQAMIQSPQFLYLGEPELGPLELDEEGLRVRLSPYALASRLSYFLWGTIPDEPLLEAAREGRLATRADVEREARRMLDGRARATLNRFHIQWLGLQKMASLSRADPDLTDAAKRAALAETQTFVQKVILEGDARLDTLLSATFGYPSKELAPLYGIPITSDVPLKTELPNRWGLLTQISMLATLANGTEGDPIRRGKWVREELLCQTLAAPPANIPLLPPPMPGLTARKRHEAHFVVQPCKGCHQYMDLIGFGFDQYDAVGKFHATQDNQPVDVTGTVMRMDGSNHPFTGPKDLISRLTQSDEVRRCVSNKWLRFALGRGEQTLDAPALGEIRATFKATDYNLRELLVAIATSPSFTHRALNVGEKP